MSAGLESLYSVSRAINNLTAPLRSIQEITKICSPERYLPSYLIEMNKSSSSCPNTYKLDEAPYFMVRPGHRRVLKALNKNPKGLTVKELTLLTKKDRLSEETPEGSIRAWLKELKDGGHVDSLGKRHKRWFFVQDF